MAKKTIDFDTVREIVMALPDVEETTIHGAPSFKLRGKLLTCQALDKSVEPNTLAVRIDFDQRAEQPSNEEPHEVQVHLAWPGRDAADRARQSYVQSAKKRSRPAHWPVLNAVPIIAQVGEKMRMLMTA
jgi:hypothetical protein